MKITPDSIPEDAMISHALKPIDYEDTFAVFIPGENDLSLEKLVQCFFRAIPPIFLLLFGIRNVFAGMLGLKTGKTSDRPSTRDRGNEISDNVTSFFHMYGQNDAEIMLGEDDKHLDFRLSMFRFQEEGFTKIMVSTVVRYNNKLGRLYFFFVRPFHKIIVPIMLRRFARTISQSRDIQNLQSS